MANPVTDTLQDWQIDTPPGTDLNTPKNQDKMTVTSATSLPGELREIKSVVRQFTTDQIWINYTGLKTPPSPDPTGTAAAFINTDTFTLIGDWTAIATLGRCVRVTFKTTTTPQAATPIQLVSVSGGGTTIRLSDPILTSDMAYVEFSAINPDPAVNPFWLNFDQTEAVNNGIFVVPTSQGGTGTSTPTALSPDVTGSLGANTVEQIQHVPVSAGPYTAGSVLSVNAGPSFGPQTMTQLLSLAQSTASPVSGYVTFGTDGAAGSPPLVLQYTSDTLVAPGNLTIAWANPAAWTTVYGVWLCAGGSGTPGDFLLSATDFNVTAVTVHASQPVAAFPANTRVFVLGVGI